MSVFDEKPIHDGISRRELIKRLGMLGAAATLMGGWSFPPPEPTAPAEPFLTGFNDGFMSFEPAGRLPAALADLRAANGRAIRQNVDWRVVQPDEGGPYDWSTYDPLLRSLVDQGVQILPVLHGCPDWAGPQGPPEADASWHTCDPAHDDDFGGFAAEVVRFFDSPTREGAPVTVRAIEIGNEPNTYVFGGVPAARLRELSNIAASQVEDHLVAGDYSFSPAAPDPIRVVSGGLATVAAIEGSGTFPTYPNRGEWRDYLEELVGGGDIAFDVGIHPYETNRPPNHLIESWAPEGTSPYSDGTKAVQYGAWQATEINSRYDDAERIVAANSPNAGLWVTETGASSANTWDLDIFQDPGYRQAWGERIQAGVLGSVAGHLASSPRCAAMFVHRLYSVDDAWNEQPGQPHYRYGVYDPPLTPEGPYVDKLARRALAARWG